MAPKASSSAAAIAKSAAILAYIRNSGVAHNIKDLEKALPAAASVVAMQVKEFVQALVDDDKIRVEKVGSGNWYWSFPGEERDRKQTLLNSIRLEHNKVETAVQTLREAVTVLEERQEKSDNEGDENGDEDQDGGTQATGGESREELRVQVAALEKEVEIAKKKLAAAAAKACVDRNEIENGNGRMEMSMSTAIPTRISQKKQLVEELRDDCYRWTDQILSMEGWLHSQMACDHRTFVEYKREWYGDEWDGEEEGLREVC